MPPAPTGSADWAVAAAIASAPRAAGAAEQQHQPAGSGPVPGPQQVRDRHRRRLAHGPDGQHGEGGAGSVQRERGEREAVLEHAGPQHRAPGQPEDPTPAARAEQLAVGLADPVQPAVAVRTCWTGAGGAGGA
ncbi:hypothetical protein [Streptacidiphilus sp. PAMC 29251]